MSDSPILRIAVNVPLSRDFDYLPPNYVPPTKGYDPAIGCRVRVPFGRREQIGMVIGHSSNSEVPANKLKRCVEVLDEEPLLNESDLWLIRFT